MLQPWVVDSAIVCDITRDKVLDMTAKKSGECRNTSVDLIRDNPKHLKRYFNHLKDPYQRTLFPEGTLKTNIPLLNMPRRIDWKSLEKAYEIQPSNYEQLLFIPGIGPGAIRALALISDLIWGSSPSWKDPVKFTFAHGGKDGVPRPVDRRLMDYSTRTLQTAIEESKLGKKDKISMLKRLTNFIK
jgi:hypothetical protein